MPRSRELRRWLAHRHCWPLGALSTLVFLGVFWSWLIVMPHPDHGWVLIITGFPGALVAGLVASFVIECVVLRYVARRYSRLPICHECGYELVAKGNESATVQCPECGVFNQMGG